ncbi:hypothetical protein MKX01_005664 [Papaver californicum]|nr:hypothetical protein MKX01_005664 [Papaver californicum]
MLINPLQYHRSRRISKSCITYCTDCNIIFDCRQISTTKFSDNTERYQLIHSIKKSEPGVQVKRVIDFLQQGLTNNLKVNYDGKRFSYKPAHDIKNKTELLQLIRENPEGIAINLQALKASGDVWWLSNSDSREDVAYPNIPG